MEARTLQSVPETAILVSIAQGSDLPVIVLDGEDECLVAMRPAVFERLLYETSLLDAASRVPAHF